jgi:hypothetical protein
LPSAIHSPCRAGGGLSPPSKCALPGAPMKNATRLGGVGRPGQRALPAVRSGSSCPRPRGHR